MSSCTRAACAATGPTTRPTTPFGAITAMSACTPSAAAAVDRHGQHPGIGIAGDDLRRQRRQGRRLAQARAAPAAARPRSASARCSCSRTSRSATCCAAPRSRRAPRAGRRSCPDVAHRPTTIAVAAPPCTRENTPNVTAFEHRHASPRLHLRRDQDQVADHHREPNRIPVRWRIRRAGVRAGRHGSFEHALSSKRSHGNSLPLQAFAIWHQHRD